METGLALSSMESTFEKGSYTENDSMGLGSPDGDENSLDKQLLVDFLSKLLFQHFMYQFSLFSWVWNSQPSGSPRR